VVRHWIGVGLVMPMPAIAVWTSSQRAHSVNASISGMSVVGFSSRAGSRRLLTSLLAPLLRDPPLRPRPFDFSGAITRLLPALFGRSCSGSAQRFSHGHWTGRIVGVEGGRGDVQGPLICHPYSGRRVVYFSVGRSGAHGAGFLRALAADGCGARSRPITVGPFYHRSSPLRPKGPIEFHSWGLSGGK